MALVHVNIDQARCLGQGVLVHDIVLGGGQIAARVHGVALRLELIAALHVGVGKRARVGIVLRCCVARG